MLNILFAFLISIYSASFSFTSDDVKGYYHDDSQVELSVEDDTTGW